MAHITHLGKKYSHIFVSGDLLFVSGQVGCDLKYERMERTPGRQIQRAYENVKDLLEREGSSLADVCMLRIYLTNMDDYEHADHVYDIYFPHKPARSVVETPSLPLGSVVMVEAIARKK